MSCDSKHCSGHHRQLLKYPLSMYKIMYLNRWHYFTKPAIKHTIKIYWTAIESRISWITKR